MASEIKKPAHSINGSPPFAEESRFIFASRTVELNAKFPAPEAMTLRSNICAPISRRIVNLLVRPTRHDEAKDLLVTIAP